MSKRVTNKKSPARKRKGGARVLPARSGVRLGRWKIARALRIADAMERAKLAKASKEE